MNYREPLPEDCPPDGAEEITTPRIVYPLVRSNPPTDDDFRSQRAENPHRVFRRVTECQTRGVSVRTDLEEAIELMILPRMQGRLLCQVQLDDGAGRIMQTGEWPNHSTWWPLADFDILANCRVVVI